MFSIARASLIPELEDVIRCGSSVQRTETLRRITDFFADRAGRLNESHVQLFDDVLCRLASEVDANARTELSARLAVLANAPRELIRRLATDDDVAVARVVLRRSQRLDQSELVEIAETKSQGHLLALSKRKWLPQPVIDILVRRGDQGVLRSLAENLDARLSDRSFATLAARAAEDTALAEKVALRPDVPPRLFREILLDATQTLQQRLLAMATPEIRSEIIRVLAEISARGDAQTVQRDYANAYRKILDLSEQGKLGEATLVEFAQGGQSEDMIAALSFSCAVPIDVVERLMATDRPDPVLILCKSAGWSWQTVKAILETMPRCCGLSNRDLDMAYENFERLSPATAQRVMRFWQVQHWQRTSAAQ